MAETSSNLEPFFYNYLEDKAHSPTTRYVALMF